MPLKLYIIRETYAFLIALVIATPVNVIIAHYWHLNWWLQVLTMATMTAAIQVPFRA